MNRLKELRTLNNYSLRDLHKLTGIANSTISEIETGKRKMNFNHAEKFSKVFGFAPYYIMGTDAIKFEETRKDGMKFILNTILDELVDDVIKHDDEEGRRFLACSMVLDEFLSNDDLDDVLSLLEERINKGKKSCM